MTLPLVLKSNDSSRRDRLGPEDKSETYSCNVCGKNFHRKASLTAHLNSHQFNTSLDGKFERESRNTCNLCLKKFSAKKNLLKHLRDVHKNFSEADRMVVKKIKCPERNCKFLCRMMKELRGHIEKSHKIKILKDTLQFPTETVFQKWKKEEETNTVSWFVTGRKKTTLMDGTKKQTLYCHRTGHYIPKGFGKYRMRSVGSCKIGVTCPAAMEVAESPDGGVTVMYYKTHLGHMQDVVYLKLSTEERAQLAEKIKQGFSFDAILDDVKESRHFEKDKKTKRIHLLSKKDLYSIMRTVNCRNRKTRREGDEESVNRDGLKFKESEIRSENSGRTENEAVGKIDENARQDLRPPDPGLIQARKQEFEEENLSTHQKHRDSNVLPQQTSREGLASQIVIVSPDIEYTSVAEIIFLSANEPVPGQTAVLSHPARALEVRPVHKPDTRPVVHDDRTRPSASGLLLQLREKLDRISGLLPQTEHLTPKQFDLVHAKLDSVLEIFGAASEKANAKKKPLKSREKAKPEENVFGHRLTENPLVYTLYN